MTASVTDQTQDAPNPWEGAAGLVFLGFRVVWPKRVADHTRNLEFSRHWEQDFQTWNVADRHIDLSAPSIGYFVRLDDGAAYFTTESAAAYSQAVLHVTELLGKLTKDQDAPGFLNIEAQYLQPVNCEFDKLVAHLDERLANPLVRDSVGGKTVDLAYLVDMVVKGIWRQVNIGPVRASEVRRRVAARVPRGQPPAVAIFLSVTSRKPFRHELGELSALVSNTSELGRDIMEAIRI